jgi:hypothetical protein
MDRLAFQWRLRLTGSISAPARKVSSIDPTPARNVTMSVPVTCSLIPGRLPATAPTTISTNATGTPMRILTTDANSAIPIQMAAS